MSRWKAAGIHFCASMVIFLVLLTVIMQRWYPGMLFTIDGGWSGLRLVLGVDLMVGPLLTLIVFKSGKPGLKFDLSCIVVFQASCMLAGVSVVYGERPIALVLAYDTLYSIAAKEFESFEKDPTILGSFPGSYPKLIYVELPESEVAASIANVRSQFIGDPLYTQTENYRAMPNNYSEAVAVYRREGAQRSSAPDEIRNSLDESCLFSKFISSVTDGFVCLDASNGEISEFFETEEQSPEILLETPGG